MKPFEELTIKDDYWFKRIMSNKKLCKKLLEIILDIKIKDIKYIEGEKTMQPGYAGKGIRLDVYAEDDKNTVYNIEMQVRRGNDELSKRIRYYQSAIDTDMLLKGKLYAKLKDTYIIFICPFKLFDGKRCKYTFKNICMEDKNLELKDGATKILLTTKGDMEDVSPKLKSFLEYIEGKPGDDDEFVRELKEESEKLKMMEEERRIYMIYEMRLLEIASDAKKEGRKEGEKLGEKRGEKRGELRLSKLITRLMKENRESEIALALSAASKRKELYKKYGIE